MKQPARVFPLTTRRVEKVWGRTHLPAPFDTRSKTPIGEIWFEPPAELDQLLVKYLFTSEKLSVQVHPSDADAQIGEDGKDECWLVLDAEPGARLAIGFEQSIAPDQIEAAARDGSIEQLLSWREVSPGDVFFLPAGTVHAIGPGLALIEVQQNSDTTFRLYDYGRPRELHLERAIAVARGEPYPPELSGTVSQRGEEVISGRHFRLDRVLGQPSDEILQRYQAGLLALPLSGQISSADGTSCASAGGCLYADDVSALDFSAAEVTLLTCPTGRTQS